MEETQGPIGGCSAAVGGGASSLRCSLTSGEGKSPTGMSIERQIRADRGGDAMGRSGRVSGHCSKNRIPSKE